MIDDPVFYALAAAGVLLAGLSKGGFGSGLGILAVPLMSLRVSPVQAAAIMLPLLCLMDVLGVWRYRASWSAPNMVRLVPAALAGIALGAATFRYIDPEAIKLLLGLIALGFALDFWIGPWLWRRNAAAAEPPAPNWPKAGLWGGAAGFTSFVAHAGGPPLSIYLLPQRLDKTLFVGTTVVFFAIVNYAKLVPYAWLGQFPAVNLMTALVLAPLAPAGMWLGFWLHDRVDERLFYRLCYALLAVAGAKLCADGIAALA